MPPPFRLRSRPVAGRGFAAALGVLLLLGVPVGARAQAPAPPADGMVEQPCPVDAFGRTPVELAYARAIVTDGPPDAKALGDMAREAADRERRDARRQATDWADLCRYREQDARDLAAGGVRLVFLGDSITELWKAAEPELFTRGVVNRGVSGQTSGQALLRFEQDVVALHPRAVHILIGTNDVAGNTGPNRPDDLKNNIRAMVALAKANHIAVLLGAIPPAGAFPWRPSLHPAAQIRELDGWLAGYARTEGLVFVDYRAVLAGPDGAMAPGISRDGVHPLVSGYRRMDAPLHAAMERAHLR